MSEPGGSNADLLCVDRLQHAFVLTGWEGAGAQSYWASELLCPTCGTTITRDREDSDWVWNAPADP